ncbi:MAG: STAS domain-containing protein [Planctomycetaceae bacterium]|nr:STAS domain-containing protein [Planctomycetaceae bacterium]
MAGLTSFQSSFLELSEEQGVTVALLTKPQLTEDENLEKFDEDLNTLVETLQVRRLVINLERLNYFTSSALGRLIALHRRIQRAGGRLVLCSAGDDIRQIFQTARLWDYFHMANSVSEAVSMLTQPQE